MSWPWVHETKTVKFALDTGNVVPELSETNNQVTDRTDALSLGIWVEQSSYNFFNEHVIQSGWGGNSFDDWLQRHVNIWNDMFADAGIYDRVRLAKVVIKPDGALNCNGNLPEIDSSIDLIWGFMAESVGVSTPANCTFLTPRYRDDQTTWDRDMGLIHELNHARYHIDLYGLNFYVHARPLAKAINATVQEITLIDPPDFPEYQPPVYFAIDGELIYCTTRSAATFGNCTRGAEGTTARAHGDGATAHVATIRVQDGKGNAIVGSNILPVDNPYGQMVYEEPYAGSDIMDGGVHYGEYSAYVFNRIAGQRARCGNANAPCNIGEFLDEIPVANILEVRNESGQPIANASVELYRARPYDNVWYARQFMATPDRIYVTDSNGQVDLGPTPFSESGDITHTWGYSNAILLLKITTPNGTYARFLDITSFNLAYWKGFKRPTFTVSVGGTTTTLQNPIVTDSAFPINNDFGSPEEGATTKTFPTGNLLIAQATTNNVAVLNADTGAFVRQPVPVGGFPQWMVGVGDRILVANGQSSSVTALERKAYNVASTLSVQDDPRGIAILEGSNNYAYVVNNGSRSVSVLNLNSGSTAGTLPLNAHPEKALTARDGKSIYAVSNTPGKVTTISTHNNQIVDWLHVGRQPHGIASSLDGQLLYVLDFNGLLITIDAIEGTIYDVLALPGQPHRILISPDGSRAYIANNSLDQLYIVDLHMHGVVSTIDLGGSQWAMEISPDGQYLFVPLYDDKKVIVIDTSTNEVVRTFNTTGNPTAVLLDQPTFRIFLTPVNK